MEGHGLFTPVTFEVLAAIEQTPTAAFYIAHKAEFKQHVEQPLQRLMRRAAERLPGMMQALLETRHNVFSRFIKNDFGRGGAWSNYWGAFYPKGSRRLEDVQLAAWINHTRLGISFYIGDYGRPVRERFRANLEQHWAELPELLGGLIANPHIQLPREGRAVLDEQGYLLAEQPMEWGEWLAAPQDAGYWAFRALRPVDVITMTEEDLVCTTADTLADLFPLALLAMQDDPSSTIRSYLAG